MNLRRDRYVTGGAFYVRTVYHSGGRSYRIFDRTLRWRGVARKMRAQGLMPSQIAGALGRSRENVERALSFAPWPVR